MFVQLAVHWFSWSHVGSAGPMLVQLGMFFVYLVYSLVQLVFHWFSWQLLMQFGMHWYIVGNTLVQLGMRWYSWKCVGTAGNALV
jgi:hypothetical protein